ncbi:MAG: YbhB/YbcL family Raf kinase inhibitor-like protein [Bacteriovoracia bacterium]
MKLTSPEFNDGYELPNHVTSDAENISPRLEWSDLPEGCRSLVLTCEDTDQAFNHWIIYNISPAIKSLPADIPTFLHLESPIQADQGVNSFGRVGYRGPQPPLGGGSHHYVFTLYALDANLALPAGLDPGVVAERMESHVLAKAELAGSYATRKHRPRLRAA